MATPRPPRKGSIFDRLRKGASSLYHSANEMAFGEIDEATGRRVSDYSPEEYGEYVRRSQGTLPAQAPGTTQAAASFREAPGTGESQWLTTAKQHVGAQNRGKRLGTQPLRENLPIPEAPILDLDPFAAPPEPEEPELAGIVERSLTPESDLQGMDLKRSSSIAQALSAQDALAANETEEEALARTEEEQALAEEDERIAAEIDAQMTGGDGVLGTQLREGQEELRGVGRGLGNAIIGGASRLEDAIGSDEDNDNLFDRAAAEGMSGLVSNVARRVGGNLLGGDVEPLERGEGMWPDIATDVAAGLALPGAAMVSGASRLLGGAKAGRRAAGLMKSAMGTAKGRAGLNALEEMAIRGTAGVTDPEDDVGVAGAGAAAGVLTRPMEKALGGVARLGGRALQEVAETGRVLGKAAGMGEQLDPGVYADYRNTLVQMGLDEEVVDSLSDRELVQAIQASAPGRLQPGAENQAALTGAEKRRLTGTALAAGGALAASQEGEEGDRAAEGQEGASTATVEGGQAPAPDPNAFLALAGTLAATGRGVQAKKIVTSLVGQSADQAIKLMRRAGMPDRAARFEQFIRGSKVREPVFHGTFGDFSQHAGEGNPSGYYGGRGVAYFSTGIEDAGNYASFEGPDVRAKLNRRAEQILDDFDLNPEAAFQRYPGLRERLVAGSDEWDEAVRLAQEEITKTSGANIQPAWLRMQNPVEVYLPRMTELEDGSVAPEPVGTWFRTREDGTVDIMRGNNPEPERTGVDLLGAMERAGRAYGLDRSWIQDELWSEAILVPDEGDVFDAFELDRAVRRAFQGRIFTEDGDPAIGQFLADSFREAGFDGISMKPSEHFGVNVGGKRTGDEIHHIAFSPGQVKSVTGNTGSFDWTNPDMTLGLGGLAMLGISQAQQTEGLEGTVRPGQQSLAGVPAVALGGMITRKGVRYLSPRGLRSVSREYQLVANRLGYDPAAIGAGVINQGVVRNFEDFQAQMAESLGERADEVKPDLPIIFAESVNLAFDQAFPRIPEHTEKKALGVADAALKLLKLGRGNDKLTDIWGEKSTAAERMKRVNSHGVREALKALVLLGDAARWYRADVDNAMTTITQHYSKPVDEGGLNDAEKAIYGPNPMESTAHQALFKAILAVTSNGNKVLKNVETADKIYRHFLRTGRLTLFDPATRVKLSTGKYILGAAAVLGISPQEAAALKKIKLDDEDTGETLLAKFNDAAGVAQANPSLVDALRSRGSRLGDDDGLSDNALDEALDLVRQNNGWTKKDLTAQMKGEADEIVGRGGADTVDPQDKGIWAGETHSEGIGHARSNIHEEQLVRLERIMRQLTGAEDEAQPVSPEGVTALEQWLTTRYLGGTQANVKKAIEVLGDPPAITAPPQVLDDYLARLDEYRKLNNIEPDKLLIQYNSIAGTSFRERGNEGVVDEAGLSDKIGRFFLNLYGIHDEATVDLWATRWYRRVMGYAEVKNGKLNDAPRGWEKGEIRQAFHEIAEGLSRETGRPWKTSDVQALLWYWEKELYRLAGAKDSDKVSFAMGAHAVASGKAGNREWITQQLDQVKSLREESIGMVDQLRRDSMRDPASGAIPTLKYGDLKSGNGISFAMAPVGLAMAGAGEEGEGMDTGKVVAVSALGLGVAGAMRGKLGIKLRGVKLPTRDDEQVFGEPTEKLLQLFQERPVDTDRGEELLSPMERIYSRAIDYAYPLQKLAEQTGKKELAQQVRVAAGWQRAAELRISRDLGEVLRGAEGNEKKVIALSMAQREMELRQAGMSERTELTDDELQAVIDDNAAIPEVAASAEGLRLFYRGLLDRKLEEGVIDRATYDRIVAKGEYYVPMVRDFGYGKPTVTGTGSGRFTNRWQGIRRLTQGALTEEEMRRSIVDPFEQAIHDAMQTERAVAKQRVTNLVAGVVRENPEAMAGLIREVVHHAKDISDEGLKKATQELATAENELVQRQTQLEMKEKLVEHIRSKYDLSKPRWKKYLQKTEKEVAAARSRVEAQQDRITALQRGYQERESQSRAKQAMRDVPPALLADMRRVQAIVDGKVKTYEVLDEDLFNAWAAAPPQVQDALVRFLNPAKRLLQTTVTALPDFGIANAMRDFAMTSTQYPVHVRRVLSAGAMGAGAGALYGSSQQDKDAAMGAAVGASLATLPFTAKALAEHTTRVFFAMRDVLAAQAGGQAARAGGAFGGMIGAGVGAATAEEGDRLEGAAAGAGAGAAAGALGAKLMAKYGDPAIYERWVLEGGAGFGFFPRTQEDTKRFLSQLRSDGVDPRSILHPGSIWDAVQLMNQAIEEAPRVARFRDALARGETPMAAAAESRDISLDFARKGSSVSIQRINESTAFYNAKLQGTSKLVRLLKDPKTWGVGMATLTAPTIALWNINKDDPAYKQRPTWEKNLFWHIPKPEGGFWLLPKPFEVGFLFASLPERVLDWMHEEDPELLNYSLSNLLGSATEGYLPIPTMVRPIGEAIINYDIFRGQPVVGPHLKDRSTQRQFDNRTSSLARGLGAASSVVMPGDGVSPEKIDHVVRGYTGGVGRMALDAMDSAARVAGVDERPAPVGGADPIVGRFNARPDVVTEPERALRRRYAKANATYRELKAMLNEDADIPDLIRAINTGQRDAVARIVKGGEVPMVIQYLAEHGEEINSYNRLKKAKRFLDQATTTRRWVESQKNLSREQRRRLIEEINRKVGEEARRVVGGEVEARKR